MKPRDILIWIGLVLGLMWNASASPTVTNVTIGDSDGIINYGTTYLFNVTVGNVTNLSWSNVTACTINGVAMTAPAGNGTGKWNYSGTVNSFVPDMGENCTYTTVTVLCTYNSTQTKNTTNSSWTMIPCMESMTDSALIDTIDASTNYLQFDSTEYFDKVQGVANNTPVNATTATVCKVECWIEQMDGGSVNITAYMPEVTYNATHSVCPYDCTDRDSDTIKISQVGYMNPVTPEAVYTSNVLVYLFSLGVAGALAYGIGSRRGRREDT